MEKNHERPNVGIGLGIAGLVLGIIALPLALMRCTFMGGLILGVLGVALSAVGYTQAKRFSASTSLLMAALIISVVSTSIAAIQFSKSVANVKKIPWHKIGVKLEELDESSNDFEKIFEEEFERELGGELEEVLKELENELDDLGEEIEDMEELPDSVKAKHAAYKLGKATGKALRGFVDEMKDTTDID